MQPTEPRRRLIPPASANPKLRGRRAKVEHIARNEKGEYIYTGGYYLFEEGRFSWRGALAIRLGLASVMMAANVACGFITAPGLQNTFYVNLPYAAALIAAALVVWAAGRIAWWGNPLREYIYQKTVEALPKRCIVAAVFDALMLLGVVVYLILHGLGTVSATGTVLHFVLPLLSLGCALILRRFERSQLWTERPAGSHD